jgi:hypothetical protein
MWWIVSLFKNIWAKLFLSKFVWVNFSFVHWSICCCCWVPFCGSGNFVSAVDWACFIVIVVCHALCHEVLLICITNSLFSSSSGFRDWIHVIFVCKLWCMLRVWPVSIRSDQILLPKSWTLTPFSSISVKLHLRSLSSWVIFWEHLQLCHRLSIESSFFILISSLHDLWLISKKICFPMIWFIKWLPFRLFNFRRRKNSAFPIFFIPGRTTYQYEFLTVI